MKKVFYKWCLFILPLILFACKKVISVNLNDAAPQIVVEGMITNTPGPYQVQITKTVNFDASNSFPAVLKAAQNPARANSQACLDNIRKVFCGSENLQALIAEEPAVPDP